MKRPEHRPTSRRLAQLCLATLLIACAQTRDIVYDDVGTVMLDLIQPLVEDTLPDELGKAAAQADFARIEDGAMRAAGFFELYGDPDESAENTTEASRKSALAAAAWLRSIATAAAAKRFDELARLHGQVKEHCARCHEY